MRAVVRAIDSILNRFTMYRVVLYGLIGLLATAEVLAVTGAISISAAGLAATTTALVTGCYLANRLLAWLLRAAPNNESWLITGLILACLFAPSTDPRRLVLALCAGLIAMASKYVLVWRGSHVFNPAAVGAFIMSIAGLLPATWWVASPMLVPFTVLLALVALRKQRKFSLFIAFATSVVLMLLFVSGLLHDQPVTEVLKNAALSWPIIFMGSIMLTEPTTLPATRYYQILFGILVGAVFASQLHLGSVATTPQLALLIGNLFTLAFAPSMGAMLRLKYIQRLSGDIYSAVFERPARTLAFAAGQYMEWTLPHAHVDSRGNRRTFSIASSPTEPDIHIGFRRYERSSSFKIALLALKPGQYIRAAHVTGNFTLPANPSQPLLFIAGGIGITPMRSMVQYLVDTGQQCNIIVLYFAAKTADFVYQDVLDGARAVGVTTQYIVGRPDASGVTNHVPDLLNRTVYVSGPDALVSSCKATLRGLGVPAKHIHTDHFTGY
jgi:glycine betaine catabolism B